MTKFKPIHKHLLIKATIKSPMVETELALEFLEELVHKIGMNPVTEPQATYVDDEGNEGFTGSINLATSHIAFHCWDNEGLLMMDVYSCKDFDERIVLEHIEVYMGLVSARFHIVDRNNDRMYEFYVPPYADNDDNVDPQYDPEL